MQIRLENICKRFNDVPVLENINMHLHKGKIICIVGPSGCGKSTFLNLLSRLDRPDSGTIQMDAATKTAYVFQDDRLLPWESVYDNIRFVKDAEDSKQILSLIEDVGLKGYEEHLPDQLSGGMRQRCSIARAFYYGSDLLLMDEPFKSLDFNLRFEMIEKLLLLWEKSQCAIVFVTHEIDEALLLGDEILVFSKRPAHVLESLEIKTPQRERKLGDPQLLSLRAKIVENILG